MAIDIWKRVDLSPSHAYLMAAVLNQPGIQAGALAEILQLTPSTITRFIERLEAQKLVKRRPEGKTTLVFPTARGKELEPMLNKCVEDFHRTYTDLLGKKESELLVENLYKMIHKF